MKTACIYHSIDLDGWMSAAIVKHWHESIMRSQEDITGQSQKQYHKLDFIGYNYGQPIPDLSDYDKVIMCDISFPKEEMEKIAKSGIGISNFIWIDHHISAIKDISKTYFAKTINGLRDTKFAACELTWKYFFPNDYMPEIVRLLGRYDCFGHKSTDEETKVLEFQYGARQCISNYEEAYNALIRELEDNKYCKILNYDETIIYEIHTKGKSIYQYLCTEAKQSYKNGFTIQLIEEITDNIGKNIVNRKFICINKERFNPINFGIDYHAQGYDGAACFHFDGKRKLWAFSLYNDNGKVDCSVIAKQFGGGGHKGAAGFVTNDLTSIL